MKNLLLDTLSESIAEICPEALLRPVASIDESLPSRGQRYPFSLGDFTLEVVLPDSVPSNQIRQVRALLSVCGQKDESALSSSPKASQQDMLLDFLLRTKAEENLSGLMLLADQIGINLYHNRILCLFRTSHTSSPEYWLQIRNYLLFHFGLSHHILYRQMGMHSAIFCVPCLNQDQSARSALDSLLRELTSLSEIRMQGNVRIGVSETIRRPEDYLPALMTTRIALRSATDKEPICYADEIPMMLDLALLPEPMLQRIFQSMADILENDSEMFETATALLDANLDYSKASARLYIHKNTFYKRMLRMRDALGLDPVHRDSDALQLAMLLAWLRTKQED